MSRRRPALVGLAPLFALIAGMVVTAPASAEMSDRKLENAKATCHDAEHGRLRVFFEPNSFLRGPGARPALETCKSACREMMRRTGKKASDIAVCERTSRLIHLLKSGDRRLSKAERQKHYEASKPDRCGEFFGAVFANAMNTTGVGEALVKAQEHCDDDRRFLVSHAGDCWLAHSETEDATRGAAIRSQLAKACMPLIDRRFKWRIDNGTAFDTAATLHVLEQIQLVHAHGNDLQQTWAPSIDTVDGGRDIGSKVASTVQDFFDSSRIPLHRALNVGVTWLSLKGPDLNPQSLVESKGWDFLKAGVKGTLPVAKFTRRVIEASQTAQESGPVFEDSGWWSGEQHVEGLYHVWAPDPLAGVWEWGGFDEENFRARQCRQATVAALEHPCAVFGPDKAADVGLFTETGEVVAARFDLVDIDGTRQQQCGEIDVVIAWTERHNQDRGCPRLSGE